MSPSSALARVAVAAAALFALAAAQDACTYKDETSCLKAGGRTDYACAWCKSAAIPSSCATLAEASKLPPGPFECGNSTQNTCEAMKSNATCGEVVGCSWCTSKTVGPICANYMNASYLPKSVFTCFGPYLEEAEAEEAAPAAVAAAAPVAVDAGKYDFFMLVQQWAITECQDVFSCTATNQYFTLCVCALFRNDGQRRPHYT